MEITAEDQHIRIICGFEAYVLGNEHLEVAVVPELGARLVSLKNRVTGREWLWHPGDKLRLFPNNPGDDFATSTLAGADECLPTVAPCAWGGRSLPDHGEVWSRSWDLDQTAWAAGEVRTSIALAISPLRLERTVRLEHDRAVLEYALTNIGPAEEHFLWALHPLLRLEPGDQLKIPAATRDLLNGESWLDAVATAIPSGGCAKLFAGPLRDGSAGIHNAGTGESFCLEWNPSGNDTLGLWLTRGGWHGHDHFAIEPTNGAPDPLSIAAAGKRCGRLQPGETKSWAVRIRIGTK